MTELERALVALGNELEFPSTPDLWPGVHERLHRRSWFRPAVFAVALGLVAVGIAFGLSNRTKRIIGMVARL